MLDFAEAGGVNRREVPVEIGTALARADWRQYVAWPVSLTESNDIATAQASRALDWACGLQDKLTRDACMLALPNILSYGRAITLFGLAIARAAASGNRLRGIAPELTYLATGKGAVPARIEPIVGSSHYRLQFMRRLLRIKSWTRNADLPRALLQPDAVAVSHNPLLRAVSADDARAIGFHHGDALLAKARAAANHSPSLEEVASGLADLLLGDAAIDEPYRTRALLLLRAMAGPHLSRAGRDMAGLRTISLPGEVWSGSGGQYAPRAVGLEVLRRNGRVIRFDHGTPRGFVRAGECTALLELAVSSEFVLTTEGAAELCRKDTLAWLRYAIGAVRGAFGDPSYAGVPVHRVRGKSTRVRVVYAPTQLLGFRQLLPVQPPDVVYLDWQLRVAEALGKMNVELTCQPHPEGLFRGQSHPLESVAPTIRGNFAAQLRRADVFVFDYPSTTALWEAICSNAHIVFLDIGAGKLSPAIAKLFQERARVLKVNHDECNRPMLDFEALHDAVLTQSSPPDSMPLRRLLAGA